MKNMFYSILVLFVLVGCGSDNGKDFTVYDDGNGTKSPRILKVIIEDYDDENLSSTDEDSYEYNENNLLVSIKGENSGNRAFTYNASKQLERYVQTLPPSQTIVEYTYSNTIYMNNKNLPVLASRKSESYHRGYLSGAIRRYHYEINEEGKAVRLKKETLQSKDIHSSVYTEETDNKFYQYDSDAKLVQISYLDGNNDMYQYDKHKQLTSIERYFKDDNGELNLRRRINFIYKNNVLKFKEVYDRSENGEFELIFKYTYIYENKPYYEAVSLLTQ